MRFLVPTFPHDVHAVEVALVLREAGHEVALWNGADFPTRQVASVDLSGPAPAWEVGGSELAIDSRPFDVVWYRRATTKRARGSSWPRSIGSAT